ncbi:DUF2812 domain-containing protein [Sedimentibacter sp. zth1]|uniref:DUF2812 domain-containing protein n=1 Tax=Sedimentibacter sp. zth1 TaxID=2816908 RepID=UPI001A91E6C9|nr:DUF2812 domain-containing protein [Sedimentibacter sp. zth1]QSX05530.1 DUF2812 domain-containing protein [Sedimentibacter sp. zth1]
MSKKIVRYFFCFIESQQKWLNEMSSKGYRLINVGKLIYEFEKCKPNEYQYYIDFVAEKSVSELNNYKNFLEQIGYTVFSKNINLNWSYGKIVFRPYGKGMGKLATSPGTYNKELLIVEKKHDGKPFELHTTKEDRINFYKKQRNACLTVSFLTLILFVMTCIYSKSLNVSNIVAFCFFVIATILSIVLQIKLCGIKRDFNINE